MAWFEGSEKRKRMNRVVKHIEHFLLSSTIWIFFTGIVFTSILLSVQENRHEWPVYLSYISRGCLLFAPVLAFSGFRQRLRQQLPTISFVLLWGFCFLAYPYLLEALGWQEWIASGALGKVAVRSTGAWFLIAELAILVNHYWLEGKAARLWARKISLEKGILLFTALFAVFYAGLGFTIPGNPMGEASPLTVISYTLQIFIILLIYYCFYWINHYFLINKMLKQKGVIFYGFGFIAAVLLFYPVAAQLISWLPMVRQTDIHPMNNGLIFEEINALVPFFGMLFSIPFILAIKWYRQNNEITALARERSEAELKLLKQQVNPHFFFNTLNNLYALSLTQDRQTPEVILQLSELMRYVIYKGKEGHVPLAEEVKYIEDYIHLQRIRLHKRLDFRFEKDITDEKLPIPPLLFITLVENAFKHGIEPAEGAGFLHLRLESGAGDLLFSCKNSVEERVAEPGGFGLANLKRRLELLFPERHELTTEEQGQNTYTATLKLNLS